MMTRPARARVIQSSWAHQQTLLFVVGLTTLLDHRVGAQEPVTIIPITKVRESYYEPSEDGSGACCGIRLFGEWPVYRNYTNAASYSLVLPGLQGIRQWIVRVAPPGGRFRFWAYFNGGCGPFPVDCASTIGEEHPDWHAEIRRQPPVAAFTTNASASTPGETTFVSQSTDPEDQPLTHAWTFGDGGTASGTTEIHRYLLPGNFTARLTVTDTDQMSNSVSRAIPIPAPKLGISLRITSKHAGNRLEPQEVFDVRAAVSAASYGVGELSNVAFDGPPLEIPTNGFTVVEAPSDTSIGTLQPGGPPRIYDWKLKAGGLGDFVLRTAGLTGQDAVGRPVVAEPDVEEGTVTALIIGLEQHPSRIVLGEDNNGDGTINTDDALVKVVIAITNVAQVDVTGVQADDISAPLAFASRLAGVLTALDPVTVPSGNYGTIQPGAANALIRTNIYRATNYVLATARLLVSGDADGVPVRAGGETIVRVGQPGVHITMHGLKASGLTPASIEAGKSGINAPLIPKSDASLLSGHPEVTLGLVGDGVTPLLLVLQGDTQALAAANDELKVRLIADVTSGGQLAGGSLQSRLRILKEGAWVASETATMTQTDPTVYAYIPPILSDEIELGSGRELRALFSVRVEDSDSLIEELEFKIGKPPVMLIHGYNTDGQWGADFRSILERSRPVVHTIAYGQGTLATDSGINGALQGLSGAMKSNTLFPLESLVPMLLAKLESELAPFQEEWAFTRYDVVAHSQGGLLSRMLSSRHDNRVAESFRNEKNHFRGRFHRVVTIGSPHNGTRLVRYLLTLHRSAPPGMDAALAALGLGGNTPRLLAQVSVLGEVNQDKFDPWGEQIKNLNDQRPSAPWQPDPGAQFHLVQTTVNGGQPPLPQGASVAEKALGLSESPIGVIVLPHGSDGVVDLDSMAVTGPNVFRLSSGFNVSHAAIAGPGINDIFGGEDGGQVAANLVARHVIAALDQDPGVPASIRQFGPFVVPTPLSDQIRRAVDLAAKSRVNSLTPLDLSEIQAQEAAPSGEFTRQNAGPRTFLLTLTPPPDRPAGSSGVYWFAEVFGTNGVSAEGLTLTPEAGDPFRATLEVASGVLGDVVAYSFYLSSAGGTIYSRPLRVASFEPPSPAVELVVLPLGGSVPVGLNIPPQFYVKHEDGSLLRRFAVSNEVTVASAAPSIVNVSDPMLWNCASAGRSLVTATWRGLTATGEVAVIGQQRSLLPIPNPLVWLRSDAGLTLTNTNVVSWVDQSGNGFEFKSPAVANRPLWVSNAVNGLPSVRFNGTHRLNANLGTTLSNATIFSLCRFTSVSGTPFLYAFGTRNFSGLQMTLARRSGDGAYHFDGAAERLADNTIPGPEYRVFSQVFAGDGPDHHQLSANLKTLLNTRTTTGRAYSAIATNVNLGWYPGLTHFTGDLVEWIIYDRVLSVDERFEVEDYLRQRAGLAPFVPEGSLDLAASISVDYATTPPSTPPWSLDSANRSSIAGYSDAPSFLLTEFPVSNQVMRTQFTPSAGTGAVGVVFAYLNSGNFHLFDWRQTTSVHAAWGTAPAGMRWRSFHVPDGAPDAADFWSGTDPARVTAWHTNNVPWVPGRTYDLILSLGTIETAIEVNFGTTNLVTWTLPVGLSGHFGHFAHSVTNAAFGPVVLPGALPVITGIAPAGDGQWTLRWANGAPPFTIETSSSLSGDDWNEVTPTTPNSSRTFLPTGNAVFFRVRSAGVAP